MTERPVGAAATTLKSDANGQATLFDSKAAIERLDGDTELFAMLITVFQQDSRKLQEDLTSGLNAGDWRSVERAAHSLKGLAANFDAKRATEAALVVEDMARNRVSAGIEPRIEELRGNLEELRLALAQWES